MTKRKNYHDNFEEVYLRSPTVRRYLPLADQSILKNLEFQKVVRYTAARFFERHQKLLITHGFDVEDIQSCCNLWCLVFTGVQPMQQFLESHPRRDADEQRKGYYYIMMNFTSQRLCRLCDWITKKFGVDDAVNEKIHVQDDTDAQMDAVLFHSSLTASAAAEDEIIERMDNDILTQSMSSESLKSQLECFQEALAGVKTKIASMSDVDGHPHTSRLIRRAERLRDRIFDLQMRRRQQISDFAAMKSELVSNLEKYKDSLAYYATSRQTASDARKKARELCKKCGINYREWAQQQISKTGRDASEFVL